MSSPDKANTQSLCRDKLTSQGALERSDATVAPRPRRTSSEGRAQQKSVPSDVNRGRKLSKRLSLVAVVTALPPHRAAALAPPEKLRGLAGNCRPARRQPSAFHQTPSPLSPERLHRENCCFGLRLQNSLRSSFSGVLADGPLTHVGITTARKNGCAPAQARSTGAEPSLEGRPFRDLPTGLSGPPAVVSSLDRWCAKGGLNKRYVGSHGADEELCPGSDSARLSVTVEPISGDSADGGPDDRATQPAQQRAGREGAALDEDRGRQQEEEHAARDEATLERSAPVAFSRGHREQKQRNERVDCPDQKKRALYPKQAQVLSCPRARVAELDHLGERQELVSYQEDGHGPQAAHDETTQVLEAGARFEKHPECHDEHCHPSEATSRNGPRGPAGEVDPNSEDRQRDCRRQQPETDG